MTHKMAEKPLSRGWPGKLLGYGVQAAGASQELHSAPTMSLQRPLLKKLNIMPAGKGKMFQGPRWVSE